jgi:hypothetical protein
MGRYRHGCKPVIFNPVSDREFDIRGALIASSAYSPFRP